MLAAEMAGLVNGTRRSSPDPAATATAYGPRIATRTLGADPGSVRTARDFTAATLHRWGWQNAARTSRSWYLSS